VTTCSVLFVCRPGDSSALRFSRTLGFLAIIRLLCPCQDFWRSHPCRGLVSVESYLEFPSTAYHGRNISSACARYFKPNMASSQPRSNVTHLCWASRSAGQPCLESCNRDDGIPYCDRCFASGDAALKVVMHDTSPETFNKILIAAIDLPKGYKFVYWGDLLRASEVRRKARDHMIEFVPNSYSSKFQHA